MTTSFLVPGPWASYMGSPHDSCRIVSQALLRHTATEDGHIRLYLLRLWRGPRRRMVRRADGPACVCARSSTPKMSTCLPLSPSIRSATSSGETAGPGMRRSVVQRHPADLPPPFRANEFSNAVPVAVALSQGPEFIALVCT